MRRSDVMRLVSYLVASFGVAAGVALDSPLFVWSSLTTLVVCIWLTTTERSNHR